MLSDIRNYLKRNNLNKNLCSWADIINLAEKEHLNHGISDQLWGQSTHKLSKIGASLAFLIVFNGFFKILLKLILRLFNGSFGRRPLVGHAVLGARAERCVAAPEPKGAGPDLFVLAVRVCVCHKSLQG